MRCAYIGCFVAIFLFLCLFLSNYDAIPLQRRRTDKNYSLQLCSNAPSEEYRSDNATSGVHTSFFIFHDIISLQRRRADKLFTLAVQQCTPLGAQV